MSATQSGPTPPIANPYRAPPPRKRPAWRSALWMGVAVVTVVGVGYLLTPHNGPDKSGAGGHGAGAGAAGGGAKRPPTVVGVATAQKGDLPVELTELGTVTPLANVTVLPRISGALVRVDFKEGQMVKAGQRLAEIDDRPYVIALQQAEGQLLKDQAALVDARLDLTRYRTLAAQDSIAGQQVDTQTALVQQDEGVVKTDQAAVANAKLNIDYCHITAPVTGRVGLRQVDVGNYVTSSATNGLVIITEIDPMDVEFSLPEDNVPKVAARLHAGASLTATALDRAGTTTLAQGVLSTLDNQIDTSTGTVKAKARFANGSGALYPNQFVNIRLLVDTLKDAIIVPTQAVRHGSQGDYVYTVDLDENAKVTPVKVGEVNGERTQILSGLQEGDQVVTDGGDRLRDGARVVLPSDVAAMQKANAAPPAKTGFFAWIGGLFGKKAATTAAGAGAGSEGAAPAAAGGGSGGQGQWSGGGHGSGSHGGAGRLQALLTPLGLTPDQNAKVRPIVTAMREKIAGAGDDPNARKAIIADSMTQIEAVLTPSQKARFEEERAQVRQGGGAGGAPAGGAPVAAAGPSAANDRASGAAEPPRPAGGQGGGADRLAMLSDQLSLTADQRSKAQALFAAARDKAAGSSDPDARRNAMREAVGQLEAILTPEQKAKFAEVRAHMAAGRSGGASQ